MRFPLVGYHRTPSLKALESIIKHGYKIPHRVSNKIGAQGLNLFLDWHSVCDKQNISVYGGYLLKYGIDISNCLILDYDISQRLKRWSFVDQLANLDISIIDLKAIEHLNNRLKDSGPQNVLAKIAYEHVVKFSMNKIDGMVFRTTGNQPYAIIYNLKAATPLDYAVTDIKHPGYAFGVDHTITSPTYVKWIKVEKGSTAREFEEGISSNY